MASVSRFVPATGAWLRRVLRSAAQEGEHPVLARYKLLYLLTLIVALAAAWVFTVPWLLPAVITPVRALGLSETAGSLILAFAALVWFVVVAWGALVILALAGRSMGWISRRQSLDMMKYGEVPNHWLVDPAADPRLEGAPLPESTVAALARQRPVSKGYRISLQTGLVLVMVVMWRVLPWLWERVYGSSVAPQGDVFTRMVIFLGVVVVLLRSWGWLCSRLGFLSEAEFARFPLPPR